MSRADDTARLRLLYDLACAFTASIDRDELVPLVVGKCREVFDAEGASILLLDAERRELYFPYTATDDPAIAERLRHLRIPADRGIAGAVLASGESARVDDVHQDPRFYGAVDRQTGAHTRTLLCAPLHSPHGIQGVIQIVNRRGNQPFAPEDLVFLETLAHSVAVALENARRHEEVKTSEERLRAQVSALRRDLARRERFPEIVGHSAAIREVFRLMESAATSPIPVLLEGETGTGKELVARAVHRASPRHDGPFVAINCAAIPEPLLERELFGHRRGAFTGALHDQPGLFEAANGGTLFLDEIGEMPPAMQAKLLRVVQEGEVTPIGDTRPRVVDLHVISATNRELMAEVRSHRFRDDLYYRLAAFPIRLPSLRDRRDDVPLLIQHFLTAAAEQHGKRIAGIDPAAAALLERYDWPGNVRELQNELARAVALTPDGGVIGLPQLSPRLAGTRPPPPAPGVDGAGPHASLREARAAFEASYVTDVLQREHGNVSRAARALGISRAMLQRKMRGYGLR